MKKILTVVGARPQFIKSAVLSRQLIGHDSLQEIIVHTGQHFDYNMSDIFFSELNIPPPRYHLGISGGMHGHMTGQMMSEIERVMIQEEPDIVLVYGDTNSTLAAALAGVKLSLPIAHVEAGLRSYNMRMPEEVNRVVTDRISSLLFAPTEQAFNNLISEGACELTSFVGDVMYDSAIFFQNRCNGLTIQRYDLKKSEYILATIHRAENTNSKERLKIIIDSFIALSKHFQVVWPIHPRTLNSLVEFGYLELVQKFILVIDPLGYIEMMELEKNAAVIVTDSGGVQKEAFFCSIPCVTLRDETEWTELVSAGWNKLIPPLCVDQVLKAVLESINSSGEDICPYGDGNAAIKIVNSIDSYLSS